MRIWRDDDGTQMTRLWHPDCLQQFDAINAEARKAGLLEHPQTLRIFFLPPDGGPEMEAKLKKIDRHGLWLELHDMGPGLEVCVQTCDIRVELVDKESDGGN